MDTGQRAMMVRIAADAHRALKILAARLDRLPDPLKRMLQLASVLGRESLGQPWAR